MREGQLRAFVPTRTTTVSNCTIHDIPGQHGVYNQDGLFAVRHCRFRNLALSAVKNQSTDAGRILRGISATGILAESIGNALFEVAEVGGYGGGIEGIQLDGRGDDVGYLVELNGRILNAQVAVRGHRISNNAVYAQGAGIRRFAVVVDASDIGQDGVLVTARNAELTVTPTIRQPNLTRRLGGSAVRVSSSSAEVTVLDPQLTDTNRRMMYALFSDTVGAQVRVRGTMVATGASDTAVRATGCIIEFPASATLEGTHGRFIGIENVAGAKRK